MMTYQEAAALPSSEKISLIICEGVKPSKLFNLVSGTVYKKSVNYFVSGIKKNGTKLNLANSINPGINEYFYDSSTKNVYVNVGEDPKFTSLSIIHKFFFSNVPIILKSEITSGEDVEFLPLVREISSIGQQLDDENSGIVLESQGSVDFINNEGFFDPIIDTIIFENQSITFYSAFNNIPTTEIRKIFDGVIESKEFDPERVRFSVKDFVFKLRNFVNLGLFSESDGNVLESIIGTPKRRIYGQVRQARCVPLDCVLDGYPLTGTVSFAVDSDIMTGTGTQFLKELNQNDDIIFIFNNEEFTLTVDLVIDDTSARLSRAVEETITNIQVIVDSEHPYRFKNRRWHIAGHKLRQTEATILDVINGRTFKVDDNSEFKSGDVIRVNGQSTQVTRVSVDQIILEQTIFPIPTIGDKITRFPVTRLMFGERDFVPFRDFSLVNTNESIIELSPLAEFNIAREVVTDHNMAFTLSKPYEATSSANADLRTIIKPGDFVRPVDQATDSWYEVHHVGPQIIYFKTPFNNPSGNVNSKVRIKKVNTVFDDSLILVDCYGKESNNQWIKTASDCVKDLVINDAEFTAIDEDSFSQANSDCPYIMSLVFPDVGGEAPLVRDVITKINESVFGSLYGNSSQEIAYSIVNSRRPQDLSEIRDDDIISWSVKTNQKIASDIKVNYLPAVDRVTGEDGFSVVTYQNNFVTNNSGIKNTIEKTCYLFNQSDAETIAQRFAFYNSLSQSILSINAKANFFTFSVNDRIYVNLDRMYSRYGGSNKLKIGVISGISKGPYNSEVEMNDLGNIFNRCPVICPVATNAYNEASDDEKIKYGFILDTNTLIPGDDESDLGSGLIG